MKAILPLAALLAFASPAFADDVPVHPEIAPQARCFPVGVTVATAPYKESGRLEGDALAKFRERVATIMKADADKIPADTDLIILFKGERVTGIAVTRGGCTLGTGAVDNRLMDSLLNKPGSDGSL